MITGIVELRIPLTASVPRPGQLNTTSTKNVPVSK